MTRTEPAHIVVGVDGSNESRTALRFALNEGSLRGSRVDVVTAWEPSTLAGSGDGPGDTGRQDAQRVQDDEMTSVFAEYVRPPVVSRRILPGETGRVLVSASQDAAFLVVGTVHTGVARRAVLGSVSEHCVRHATCPVVIVSAGSPPSNSNHP
jgi:nucleotide-binding universal stress UspA family protein